MVLKLRTKIFLGLLSLFAVIFLLVSIGITFIRDLDKSRDAILQDNLSSVEYALVMLKALDEMHNVQAKYLIHDRNDTVRLSQEYENATMEFESGLHSQENNISEDGENELMKEISKDYQTFKQNFYRLHNTSQLSEKTYTETVHPVYERLRMVIFSIYVLNKEAIFSRNQAASQTAVSVTFSMLLIGGISLVLTFIFVIQFPDYITKPISRLTEKMNLIADHDYEHTLDYRSKDELGEMAAAFNKMTLRLREYEESAWADLMFEKKRAEAITRQLGEAVFVLDESKMLVSMNPRAEELFKVSSNDLLGKHFSVLSKSGKRLRDLAATVYQQDENRDRIEVSDNGKSCLLNIKVTPIEDERGELLGQVIILENVTAFTEEQDRLKKLIYSVLDEVKSLHLMMGDDVRNLKSTPEVLTHESTRETFLDNYAWKADYLHRISRAFEKRVVDEVIE